MKTHRTSTVLLLASLLGASAGVQAAVMSVSLGNTAPGFSNGDTPLLLTQIMPAQLGQPAPFDTGLGSDLSANAAGAWTFAYAAISDPILGASIDIGIIDHDSQASGDQVALFTVAGNDLTAALNAALEGSGGGDGEYNVYSLDLSSLLPIASLAAGSVDVVLNLAGPGLQTCTLLFLCPPPAPTVTETAFNGAHYIFSTLTVRTEDPVVPPVPGVPEPATLGISLLGLGLVGWRRRAARA